MNIVTRLHCFSSFGSAALPGVEICSSTSPKKHARREASEIYIKQIAEVNFPERIFVLLFMFFALSAFAVSVASLTQAGDQLVAQALRQKPRSWGHLAVVVKTDIPFWLAFGEFTTHFRTYFSGWIESDVHWGYGFGF